MSARVNWPDGVARHVVSETDSTNALAARLAPGLSGPTWIMATRQTAARGRRGRAWQMAEGNFGATLVFRPKGTVPEAALFSFVAALALHEALALATGRGDALALKWPNDVLLGGGKVSGILLESLGHGTAVGDLAIGIGVNLIAAPAPEDVEPGALAPVSVLGVTGIRIAPEAFLDLLAPAFATWAGQLERFGFAPIRAAWLARAARLGEPITARVGGEALVGVFETLDDTGALVLRQPEGRRAIAAADIYF